MVFPSPAVAGGGVDVDHGRSWADAELARLRAEVVRLQAEREALRWAVGHDDLTGLPNRRLFLALAPSLISRNAHPTAVIVADLDNFKPINDRYGHYVGDDVLRTVARRLAVSAGDNLVARLGGDEFAAVLTCPSRTNLGRWWQTAITTISTAIAEPMPVAGTMIAVTASIGVAPAAGRASINELLHQADLAMYRAKRDVVTGRHARRSQ